MKADFASTLDFTKQAEAITENGVNGVNGSENAVASLDRRYINPDLIGQDSKVNETLAMATEGLRQAYMKEHNATHEQAVEAVKDITAFKGELSDKGKASYSKFKKGLNYLNGVSGHTVNMVVVDEHSSFNGNISDDTIYIGADAFENDSWAEVLVHEYTHFAEGTKEYAADALHDHSGDHQHRSAVSDHDLLEFEEQSSGGHIALGWRDVGAVFDETIHDAPSAGFGRGGGAGRSGTAHHSLSGLASTGNSRARHCDAVLLSRSLE